MQNTLILSIKRMKMKRNDAVIAFVVHICGQIFILLIVGFS